MSTDDNKEFYDHLGSDWDVTWEHIRESNLIEDIDDARADDWLSVAWRFLSLRSELTLDNIKVAHYLATYAQPLYELPVTDRGQWRRGLVRIGDYVAPNSAVVPELMERWYERYGKGVSSSSAIMEAHVAFETIHPFSDGNGRVGRLLLWWHATQLGVRPVLFRASERLTYYKLFQSKDRAQILEQL